MTSWQLYTRPGKTPVPVPDRFSWLAALFGPLWFAAHASFVAAGFSLALGLALSLLPDPARTIAAFGLAWLTGLFAQSIRAAELRLRGFTEAGLTVAASADAATLRAADLGLLPR